MTLQLPLGRRGVHGRRDAVRGEHHDGTLRDLVGLVDENRPGLGQRLDHVPVVHDLVPDVDRRPVLFQRALDGLDGAVDAGAVPAWLGKQHPLAGHRLDRRTGGARPNPYVRAHVHGRRHGNQVTFCGLRLASSRGRLGVHRRLRQAGPHGYCTVRGPAAGRRGDARRRGDHQAAENHPDVSDDTGQSGRTHRDAIPAELGRAGDQGRLDPGADFSAQGRAAGMGDVRRGPRRRRLARPRRRRVRHRPAR